MASVRESANPRKEGTTFRIAREKVPEKVHIKYIKKKEKYHKFA